MQSEFDCGDTLVMKDIDDEDIENLVIQQIEFCNIIILNKVSEVSHRELERIRRIIRELQPTAKIIECDYADIDLDGILNTHLFDFDSVASSAGWIRGIEGSTGDDGHEDHDEDDEHDEHGHHHGDHDEDDEHDDHGHHHDHHHEHEGGEVEEYGIGTFVYYRRPAFDMNRFDHFVAKKWSRNIIRAKGLCYFSDQPDMSYLFEQAGKQFQLKAAGQWYATAPEEELKELMAREPGLRKDWDPVYGDRMQKIVFIGQNLDREQLAEDLDFCLVTE